jgi:hypothetical protein
MLLTTRSWKEVTLRRVDNLENLIEGLDSAGRHRFLAYVGIAEKKGASPEPTGARQTDTEISTKRQFESIGMILRNMIDKAGSGTNTEKEEESDSER